MSKSASPLPKTILPGWRKPESSSPWKVGVEPKGPVQKCVPKKLGLKSHWSPSNSYRAVIGYRNSWLALSFRAKQWRVRKTQAAGYRAGKSRCTGQDYNEQSLAHKSFHFPGESGTSSSAGLNAGIG